MSENREIVVEVKSRHGQISERMEDNAFKKVARLARYNDRVQRIEIVADHPHEGPEVEIIVHMRRGPPMVAREQGETFAATIDSLVEKMERQLKRQKEKRKNHKGNNARRGVPPKAGTARPDDDTYEDVVRRELRQ